MEDLVVIKAKIAYEIKEILTDDQIELYRYRKSLKKERIKKRFDARREKFDSWLLEHGS